MNMREVLVVGTAMATLTACSASESSKPEPTKSSPVSRYHFLADGSQSDTYGVVNCDLPPTKETYTVGANLLNPESPAEVVQTLGATESGTNQNRTPETARLVGGVTLWEEGESIYYVAASDNAVATRVDMISQPNYATKITIPGKSYSLDFRMFVDPNFGYTADITCDPNPNTKQLV